MGVLTLGIALAIFGLWCRSRVLNLECFLSLLWIDIPLAILAAYLLLTPSPGQSHLISP